MTPRTLSSFILIVIFTLTALVSFNKVHASENAIELAYEDGLAKQPIDPPGSAKTPFFPAKPAKAHHGKLHAPQMDELAHIHKFHKERVKKLKKHHDKYWMLSKLILVLCHMSVLFIAYMHATH